MRAALYKVNPSHPNTVRKMLKEKTMCFGWKCLQKDHGFIPPSLYACIWSTAASCLVQVSVLCSGVSILKEFIPSHSYSLRCGVCSAAVLEEGTPQFCHYFGLTQHRKQILLSGRNENFSCGICTYFSGVLFSKLIPILACRITGKEQIESF